MPLLYNRINKILNFLADIGAELAEYLSVEVKMSLISSDAFFNKFVRYLHPSRILHMRVLLCMVVTSIALTACTQPSTPTATPTLYMIMTAMVARVSGELVKIDGCIRIKPSGRDDSYALVWPPDHKMTIDDGHVRVESGLVSGRRREIILTIGELVVIGGGSVADLDDQLKQTIPVDCPGPYWVVGAEILSLATPTP